MRRRITNSYTIDLPDETREELDSQVSSFWQAGSDLALQLSSNRRVEGSQVSAEVRLKKRLQKERRTTAKKVTLNVRSPDQAGATFFDDQNWEWLYLYLVWFDLSVFVTLCDRAGSGKILDSWAIRAIETIERTNH